MRNLQVALLFTAAGVVAACQSSVSSYESRVFLQRAEHLETVLDKAIDQAGQLPDESRRVDELKRLGRLANQLGRERLGGYMSYVDDDIVRFRAAEVELGTIETQLPVH
jgi:hypothetical protein